MNKRTLFTVISSLVVVLGLVSFGYCYGSNVTDNGGGNKGYILINDGTGQGHRGVWTDITTVPSLKGAKGEKGDTGATGPQGIQGIDGQNGTNGTNGLNGLNGTNGINGIDGKNGVEGKDGYTPTKNIDYFDGKDGVNGKDGLNGEQGEIGLTGKDGLNGVNGTDGIRGSNGAKGDKGDSIKGDTGADGIDGQNGKDIDPILVNELQNTNTILNNKINTETTNRVNTNNSVNNKITDINNRIDNTNSRVSALESTQYNIRTELKFIREKNLEIGIYSKYNTNRNVCSEVGLNIVIMPGTSFQDQENEKVNTRLNRLEQQAGVTTVIERTINSNGKLESIKISDGQLAIQGGF